MRFRAIYHFLMDRKSVITTGNYMNLNQRSPKTEIQYVHVVLRTTDSEIVLLQLCVLRVPAIESTQDCTLEI